MIIRRQIQTMLTNDIVFFSSLSLFFCEALSTHQAIRMGCHFSKMSHFKLSACLGEQFTVVNSTNGKNREWTVNYLGMNIAVHGAKLCG